MEVHRILPGVAPVSLVVLRIVCPPETGAQTKISQFYVSVLVDQDVVWLDVSMNEPQLVNTFKSARQLSDVESRQRFFESSCNRTISENSLNNHRISTIRIS